MAAAPAAAAGLGGWAVRLAVGVVKLGFWGREGGAVEGLGRRIEAGWLRSWINSVSHLLLSLTDIRVRVLREEDEDKQGEKKMKMVSI